MMRRSEKNAKNDIHARMASTREKRKNWGFHRPLHDIVVQKIEKVTDFSWVVQNNSEIIFYHDTRDDSVNNAATIQLRIANRVGLENREFWKIFRAKGGGVKTLFDMNSRVRLFNQTQNFSPKN